MLIRIRNTANDHVLCRQPPGYLAQQADRCPSYGNLGQRLLTCTIISLWGQYSTLESFALRYSKSLLLADFKENQILLWFIKSLQKTAKQENSSLFMNSIL
jgi:hypothetical protein